MRYPRATGAVLALSSLAAFGAAPPPATLDTGPKVGYENFEAPGVFTTTVQSNGNTTEYLGRGAGEPSIGVNWHSPAPDNVTGVTNFQSDLQTLFVRFNDACPAGAAKASWENSPAPTSQGVDSDPIGFTNLTSGRVFAGELTLLSPTCKISYTDDDGASWVATTGPVGSAVDHQTIGGGPYHLIGGLPPPYSNPVTQNQAFYYCSQDLEFAYCMRSDDGGLSWEAQTPNFTLANCDTFLHGHVKVSPADGTVYVPNSDCNNDGAVAVSETNGTSWTIHDVRSGTGAATLNTGTSNSDPAVGIDSTGRVYFVTATQSGNSLSSLSVATSTDHGATWQNIANLTSQLGLNNIRYPAAVGGSAGRAAVAFLGTTTAGNANSATFWGEWHLWVAHTFDGGVSWSVTDATPTLPVQRGCIWTNGGGDICRNLLDFLDVAIDKQGRVQVGYVNGCPGGSCSQAAPAAKGNGYSATATIARQSSGRRLLAAFDPANALTATSVPGMPTVTARRVGTTVHLGWALGDTGNAPMTGFQIWRGAASGSGKALIATVAGDQSRYVDLTATDYTATYYYDVIALNEVGASCGNNEVRVAYVGDSCPGMVIHQNNPAHPESAPVQNGVNANLAIDYISVAEPVQDLLTAAGAVRAAGGSYFKFTMKVTNLASVPVNSRWRMVWNSYDAANAPFDAAGQNGQLFYVGMRTNASGAASFDYGTVGDAGLPAVLVLSEDNVKAAYPESSFNADGTITLYVPKAGVGVLAPGDLLGAFGGKTFTSDTSETGTFQRSTAMIDHTFIKGVTDNSFPAATYMLRDAAHVTDNHAPLATTFTGSPLAGNATLTVAFAAAQSDADGDAPGAYRYDFGDGTAVIVEKSCGNAPYLTPDCANATHAYANPGDYTATMWPVDSCGFQGAPLTLQVHVNAPPVADAGADGSRTEGLAVDLDGAGSSDPDGDPLLYAWVQTAGPAVVLSDANAVSPSFLAPLVTANTPLSFELTVTDIPWALSDADSVVVTVLNEGHAPIAQAGIDFTTDEGSTPLLSAAGSSDPDGDVLSYSWAQTAGPAVTLSGATTATASFTAPAVATDTPLTFELTVSDGALSASDTIVVTVVDTNDAPVANAGADLAKDERTLVTLTGAATDADGDTLTYAWQQTGGPTVTLTGASTPAASFTAPDVAEDTALTFRLTASDPAAKSGFDDVVVTVRNVDAPPAQPIGDNNAGSLSASGLLLLALAGLRRRRGLRP